MAHLATILPGSSFSAPADADGVIYTLNADRSVSADGMITMTADEAVQGVANGMPRVLASQLLRDVGTGMTMLFGGFGLCGTCALCRDLFELSLTRVQAFQATIAKLLVRNKYCKKVIITNVIAAAVDVHDTFIISPWYAIIRISSFLKLHGRWMQHVKRQRCTYQTRLCCNDGPALPDFAYFRMRDLQPQAHLQMY